MLSDLDFTHGPFSPSVLRKAGIDRKHLSDLLDSGTLRSVSQGWYANELTSTEAIRAVKLGGRLGCLSACKLYGLWVPRHMDLHVAIIPGARLPSKLPAGVQFHRLDAPCATAVVPLDASLAHVLYHHDEETGLVVLESAVDKKYLDQADARYLLRCAPKRKKLIAQHFSPLAQSGSETRLRLFFQRLGVKVQPQAWIAGIGHVDLLVGRSWIIEADSQAHHSLPRNVATDRERDFTARALGYRCDRYSFQQIWVTWEQTRHMLTTILRTREHLKDPVPL